MTHHLGDAVWARSDGTHVARGWHRGVITEVGDGAYAVGLLEYSREFRATDANLRARPDDNDTNLPVSWKHVLWRPEKNWKATRRAKT